eukprot:Sspe_Gene.55720::Locus_30645_Transcript_2_2_Confidence_0.400_Length_1130::g.55720::m.55720/K12739/PPIL6; peptidyl-prolyl cis-trans isomerase-like 6
MCGGTGVRELVLAGRMDSVQYQLCYEAGTYLSEVRSGSFTFTARREMPVDWEKWRKQTAETHPHGKAILAITDCIVLETTSDNIWNCDSFIKMVKGHCSFKIFNYPPDSDDPEAYHNAAKINYRNFLKSTGDCFCWMTFTIHYPEGPKSMTTYFQLFTKKCPCAVENFRHLCLGDLPDIPDETLEKKVKAHYKGCTIFRVTKDGWIQGGDISNAGTAKAGTGGVSIFGKTYPDECFDVSHDDEGILGAANVGPHTNGSQFYITVARNQWMDRKYVAFGKVVDGIECIREIHQIPTKPNQAPAIKVEITDCGELDLVSF